MLAFWIIFGIVMFLVVVPAIAMLFVTAPIVYNSILARRKPEQWDREYWKKQKDEEIKQMHVLGNEWREVNASFKKDVHIVNEGYNLYGEYYDFGFDRSVMILGGREDTLIYSCFYAEPYKKAKCNVLVVDVRCHGLSDGKYFGAGIAEMGDHLAWLDYLHNELKQKYIYLHGICLGGASWENIASSGKCPEYVKAIVCDGLFVSFYEIVKMHIREMKQLTFPCVQLLNKISKSKTGADLKSSGPIYSIDKVKKPLMMICGRKDQYATNPNSELLYSKLQSKKRIVWLPEGIHSHFRLRNTEAYDEAVISWVEDNQ